MKYSAIAVIAIASLAKAQIPACATECLSAAVEGNTNCGATDLACHCTDENKLAIQGSATPCLLSSCGDQVLAVLSAANAQCVAVLMLPQTTTKPNVSEASPPPPTSTTLAPTTTTIRPAVVTTITPPTFSTTSSSTIPSLTPSTTSSSPLPSDPPTSSPSSAPTSSTTQATNAAQTTIPPSVSISTASAGVKAGIAIGAIAAAAIIGLLIWIVLLLRKRHKQHEMDRNPEGQQRDLYEAGDGRVKIAEMGGAGGGTELHGVSARGELDGKREIDGPRKAELPGW